MLNKQNEIIKVNSHNTAIIQLMQLINFYCNWKTIHHRNFMVGFGKVLFTIITDERVCLWQYDYTSRNVKRKYASRSTFLKNFFLKIG